jgi:hypothetical protein
MKSLEKNIGLAETLGEPTGVKWDSLKSKCTEKTFLLKQNVIGQSLLLCENQFNSYEVFSLKKKKFIFVFIYYLSL